MFLLFLRGSFVWGGFGCGGRLGVVGGVVVSFGSLVGVWGGLVWLFWVSLRVVVGLLGVVLFWFGVRWGGAMYGNSRGGWLGGW